MHGHRFGTNNAHVPDLPNAGTIKCMMQEGTADATGWPRHSSSMTGMADEDERNLKAGRSCSMLYLREENRAGFLQIASATSK